jgi:hypothetical protein
MRRFKQANTAHPVCHASNILISISIESNKKKYCCLFYSFNNQSDIQLLMGMSKRVQSYKNAVFPTFDVRCYSPYKKQTNILSLVFEDGVRFLLIAFNILNSHIQP